MLSAKTPGRVDPPAELPHDLLGVAQQVGEGEDVNVPPRQGGSRVGLELFEP